MCQSCPVRADCLGYAMTAVERYGVWGGIAERGRRRLRRDGRLTIGGEVVLFDAATGTVEFVPSSAGPILAAG